MVLRNPEEKEKVKEEIYKLLPIFENELTDKYFAGISSFRSPQDFKLIFSSKLNQLTSTYDNDPQFVIFLEMRECLTFPLVLTLHKRLSNTLTNQKSLILCSFVESCSVNL